MTVAALLLWLCTAGVGVYLLLNGISAGRAAEAEQPLEQDLEHETVAAGSAGAGAAANEPASPRISGRKNDPWDPPTLQRAKSEEMPGLRDLAEFSHPALAFIGFGFMAGSLISGSRVFALITLGVLLCVIAAGLTWYTLNHRDAQRRRAGARPAGNAGSMRFSRRVLLVHGAGAALTLLFVALLAARV